LTTWLNQQAEGQMLNNSTIIDATYEIFLTSVCDLDRDGEFSNAEYGFLCHIENKCNTDHKIDRVHKDMSNNSYINVFLLHGINQRK
jgi:hypothetical protein